MSCTIGSPRGGDSTLPKPNVREFDVTVNYDKARATTPDPVTWTVRCTVGGCTVSPQNQDVTNGPSPGTCSFTFTAPANGDYTIDAKLIRSTGGVETEFGHDNQTPIHVGVPGPVIGGEGQLKVDTGALASVVGSAASTVGPSTCPPPIFARGKIGTSNLNDPIVGAVLEIYHFDSSTHPPQIVVDYIAIPTLVEDTFGAVFVPEARKHHPSVRIHLLKLGGRKTSHSFPLPPSW